MSAYQHLEYYGITEEHRNALIYIETYGESFLQFLPRELKNFPSHGIIHTLLIINSINNFLKNWEIRLNGDEIFLLYVAAWLHDIGCISSRTDHGEKSFEILIKDEILCNVLNLINEDVIFNLEQVIKSHPSTYSITTVLKTNGTIRLQLICAIFRLIDACEITNIKCPKAVFEEIKDDLKLPNGSPDDEAIKFWEAHMNIKNLTFQKPIIVIFINRANKQKTENVIERLKREIESIRSIFEENKIEVPIIKIK